jgi:hypothetical protein
MPRCALSRPVLQQLATSMLLVACSIPRTTTPFTPRHYSQTTDSATSACLRNPACYAPPQGEAPILPWVSHAITAARTAAAVMRLLDAADLARIEQVLKDHPFYPSNQGQIYEEAFNAAAKRIAPGYGARQ